MDKIGFLPTSFPKELLDLIAATGKGGGRGRRRDCFRNRLN
jgi:hypothetical protein